VTTDFKNPPRKKATKEGWGALVVQLPSHCQLCGSIGITVDFRWIGLSVHHVVSRAQGGADVIENFAVLCGHGTVGCHSDVEHHRKQARERLRRKLTDEQLAYIVSTKGSAWLDRSYPWGAE
jgi:5-methylcytosine-specific restriction endonuclease McrA